ncbi:hypothetical protein SMSP2_02491 [Limihaloglobus sulfuriphilus]|uniref:PEP-CTERM protein-sorting domain-containing protein n=1 Tax=Limihaloglobus sulfuriphilus TaxID=1851148 RepID=A0A1Q2MHD9_9BACT|nr:hypothetical protein [Limihaloglobus sulfuriphilus]AQQ72111.1 hypothetical protein SMSP2_02491 [Limihaloglobus sulfuriphilus]
MREKKRFFYAALIVSLLFTTFSNARFDNGRLYHHEGTVEYGVVPYGIPVTGLAVGATYTGTDLASLEDDIGYIRIAFLSRPSSLRIMYFENVDINTTYIHEFKQQETISDTSTIKLNTVGDDYTKWTEFELSTEFAVSEQATSITIMYELYFDEGDYWVQCIDTDMTITPRPDNRNPGGDVMYYNTGGIIPGWTTLYEATSPNDTHSANWCIEVVAVPEPATAVILVFGGLYCLRKR